MYHDSFVEKLRFTPTSFPTNNIQLVYSVSALVRDRPPQNMMLQRGIMLVLTNHGALRIKSSPRRFRSSFVFAIRSVVTVHNELNDRGWILKLRSFC